MGTQIELNPTAERALRGLVREEIQRHLLGIREDSTPDRVARSMERLVKLRRRIAMPLEELEEILQEHRAETGRG